jgi:hypothetical protein
MLECDYITLKWKCTEMLGTTVFPHGGELRGGEERKRKGFSGIIVELVSMSACPPSVGMVWSVSLHAPPPPPHGIRECVRNRSGGGSGGLFERETSQSNITQNVTKLHFFSSPASYG